MSAPSTTTAHPAGPPLARRRAAQRTCSPACKKALFRAEKRDAGHSDASEVSTVASTHQERPKPGTLTRIWGPNRLSEIQLRMMGLDFTGLKVGGSMPYRRTT